MRTPEAGRPGEALRLFIVGAVARRASDLVRGAFVGHLGNLVDRSRTERGLLAGDGDPHRHALARIEIRRVRIRSDIALEHLDRGRRCLAWDLLASCRRNAVAVLVARCTADHATAPLPGSAIET